MKNISNKINFSVMTQMLLCAVRISTAVDNTS